LPPATIGGEGVSVDSEDEDSTDESDIRDSEAYTDTDGEFVQDTADTDTSSNAWKGSVLYATYPDKSKRSTAHTIGKVVLDDPMSTEELVSALCDSGALDSDFIAKKLLDKIKKRLKSDAFFDTKCKVTLADSRTSLDITKGVRLNLVLHDKQSHKYEYTGEFLVIDMENQDIILGLPALTGKLYPFFNSLMKDAHDDATLSAITEELPHETPPIDPPDMLHNLEQCRSTNYDADLKQPWLNKSQDEAPEDAETDIPVQFGDALEFLGKPREEALKDYYALHETHISEAMKSETDLPKLLATDMSEKVFVADEWSGIKGIPDLELVWLDSLPARMKPRARPINPKLWEATEKEFTRLCGYLYRKSRSPWASCLVVAPKATPPYIRFCGDYVAINKHMQCGNYTIPNVKHELNKIINYKIYADIDLTNAFHQIKLGPNTSEKLSLQTPWGQYEPMFMPEGIAPGNATLQETIRDLFADFSEWAIMIFDNLLILAHDSKDLYDKIEKVIQRCSERNVKLKMAKSWLGFEEVNFFGYVCKHKSYQVSPDKKTALADIPMPDNTKKARSLLGKGVFFASFTPKYSDLVAHLPDMTKSTFVWDPDKWKHDYVQEYKDFIKGLQDACELFYPDYSLKWILRTDASMLGVGAVLLQVKILPDGSTQLQPIAFIAKKFSEQAAKWATIEQEAYGIFYAVQQLAYYLVGKDFIIETDHANLQWMEASIVPKIVRWRIFLQSFTYLIKHISGPKNWLADWLSREFKLQHLSFLFGEYDCDADTDVYPDIPDDYFDVSHVLQHMEVCPVSSLHSVFTNPDEPADPTADTHDTESLKMDQAPFATVQQCFDSVHNGQVGHMGAKKTWTRLNDTYSGHCIPFRVIEELVAECDNCVKTRLGMQDALSPTIRTLKPPHARSAIGIDAVEITPHSVDGYTHINVIVNLFTKHVFLHAVKGASGLSLANSVWKYWSLFGHTDSIISDLGPDLNSAMFKQLCSYMGMRHAFSIANRHANGCERIIGEIVRHLRATVYDNSESKAQLDVFNDPSWIDSMAYLHNSEICSELGGLTPNQLTFGSDCDKYLTMGTNGMPSNPLEHLMTLDTHLAELRRRSSVYQAQLVAERAVAGPSIDQQNRYQPGDFVLFDKGAKVHPKMSHRYFGPFEVMEQYKNDITARHMVTHQVVTVSVSDVKIYAGTRDRAYKMAMRDHDEHVVDTIISYTGNRELRTSMTFTVRYSDGDVREVGYHQELFDCQAYEDFCRRHAHTYHLQWPATASKQWIADKNKEAITMCIPGDHVYINIRIFGDDWYDTLMLPNAALNTYVTPFTCTHWYHRTSHRKISVRDNRSERTYGLNTHQVFCFVYREFNPLTMVLIDNDFATRYPQVN
jgi:hypothetical protein